jgi:glycosyltransferase involved in cell wall biosynthesis
MRLSVVIPAYNEAARLPATLEAACAWLDAHLTGDYELIIIDDGSTDATAQVTRAWTEKHPHTRLLVQPENRGKGAAVRRGMLEAEGDVRLFMDADHSTHVGEVEKVFAAVADGADVVIASRRHPDSDIEVHQSWLREHMGQGFNLIMRSLVGLPMKDTQCGFKAFTAGAARRIFNEARLDGFSFDVEIIYLAHHLGYAIAEIPVRWVNEPNSKVRMLADPARMFADVMRIRAMHRHVRKAKP